jgi:hypothetical protein
MKEHAAAVVSDDAFAKRAERWPEETPDTKEAFYIREIFDSKYLSCQYLHLTRLHLGLYPSETAAKTAVRYGSFVRYIISMLTDLMIAGYLEATGVVQLIPADEVSRYTTRHTMLINPEKKGVMIHLQSSMPSI